MRSFFVLIIMLMSTSVTAQTTVDNADATPVKSRRSAYVGMKTNLLYDAALVPNIGVEIPLGEHLSLGADWFHAWWSQDSRHRYWQGYGGYVTLRHYFGNR